MYIPHVRRVILPCSGVIDREGGHRSINFLPGRGSRHPPPSPHILVPTSSTTKPRLIIPRPARRYPPLSVNCPCWALSISVLGHVWVVWMCVCVCGNFQADSPGRIVWAWVALDEPVGQGHVSWLHRPGHLLTNHYTLSLLWLLKLLTQASFFVRFVRLVM